jgi:hypothetical protein
MSGNLIHDHEEYGGFTGVTVMRTRNWLLAARLLWLLGQLWLRGRASPGRDCRGCHIHDILL